MKVSSIEWMLLSMISSTIVFIVSKFSTSNQCFTKFTQTWFMAYLTEFKKVRNGRYIEQMLQHSLTKLGDDNSWVMLA